MVGILVVEYWGDYFAKDFADDTLDAGHLNCIQKIVSNLISLKCLDLTAYDWILKDITKTNDLFFIFEITAPDSVTLFFFLELLMLDDLFTEGKTKPTNQLQ